MMNFFLTDCVYGSLTHKSQDIYSRESPLLFTNFLLLIFERVAPELTQVLPFFSVAQFTLLCNMEEVQ